MSLRHRAVETGYTTDEIRHGVLPATTTLVFRAMISVLSWMDDVLPPNS